MSHENIIVSTGEKKITLKIIKTSSFGHKDFVLIHFNFFSIFGRSMFFAVASSDNADKRIVSV